VNRPLDGLRVLVVDDDPDSLELLGLVLAGGGAQVTACASAESALDAFRTTPPDVVVSDLSMPRRDGYWLVHQMRAPGPARGVPALALTAFGSRYRRDVALAAGFQDQIAKPVEPDELCAAVARLVRRGAGGDR